MSEWISVEDDMPRDSCKKVYLSDGKEVDVGWYISMLGQWTGVGFKPTHWQDSVPNLPDPPEDKE